MQPSRNSKRVLSSLHTLRLGERPQRKNMELRADPELLVQYQSFSRNEIALSSAQIQFIEACLRRHFIFSSFFSEGQPLAKRLSESFFSCSVSAGTEIIKQQDGASFFFLIQEGNVQILVDGVLKKEIGSGEGLGQLALLYNAPRSASCLARSDCKLFGIDRRSFRRGIEEINQAQYKEYKQIVGSVKIFDSVNPELKEKIAHLLIQVTYEDGTLICNEGEQAASFYIITRGRVRALLKGKECGRLKEGDSFGENALLSDSQVRQMSVVAEGRVSLLSLGRESMARLLGQDLQIIIFRTKIKAFLSKSQIFSKLNEVTLERIIDCLTVVKAEAGEVICKAGDRCRENLFFVLEGECTRNSLKYDFRGIFHGEDSIKMEKAESCYEFTVVMSKTGSVAKVTFDELRMCIRDSYEKASHKAVLTHLAHLTFSEALLRKRKAFSKVELNQLLFLKKLGAGQFGNVYLVTNGEQYYALKTISKVQMLEQRLEKHLQQEKRILEVVNFPFILEYIRSYKDENNIYFLLQYIKGLDLETALHMGSESPSPTAIRFYTASILLILEYIHSMLTIYRDLKPQNVMLGPDGYLKLVDMGSCKNMKTKPTSKTYTIIGTPHYMSPEALSGKGYNYSTDLWSLGVCLYEFISLDVPFGVKADDPYQIYEDIVSREPKFDCEIEQDCERLVRQLLSRVPEQRLGSSYSALKAHKYFSDFDWDQLQTKKMECPYVPAMSVSEVDLLRESTPLAETLRRESLKKSGVLSRKDFDPSWDRMY